MEMLQKIGKGMFFEHDTCFPFPPERKQSQTSRVAQIGSNMLAIKPTLLQWDGYPYFKVFQHKN
jgi:hypothetical protein